MSAAATATSPLPRLLVFSSGTKDGGGSGFCELVRNARTGVLKAQIVAVVSNHAAGGVSKLAAKYHVPFIHFNGPFTAQGYQELITKTEAEWVALSGWLKLVSGLDPKTTINIHPGPLPRFGGKGMYGHFVHEAIVKAFNEGEKDILSAVTMHFVTPVYDQGPVFFRYPVSVEEGDTGDILAARVNKVEHGWQSYVTNLVIQGQIKWDGKTRESLKVPENWQFL